MTPEPAHRSEPTSPFPPLRDVVADESDAADVVRTVLDLDDIVGGSLLLMVCDAQRRPTVPILISDVPVTAQVGDVMDHWFEQVGEMLAHAGSGIIFARGRPGQSYVVDHDRPWHDAIVRGCATSGIELLAAFVVTPHAVIPFAPPVR